MANTYQYLNPQAGYFSYSKEESEKINDLIDSDGKITFKAPDGKIYSGNADYVFGGGGLDKFEIQGKDGIWIKGDTFVPKSYTAEINFIKENTRPDGTILVKDKNGRDTVTTPQTYLSNRAATGGNGDYTLPMLNKGNDKDIQGLSLDEIISKYPDRFPGLKISEGWKKSNDEINKYSEEQKRLLYETFNWKSEIEDAKSKSTYPMDLNAQHAVAQKENEVNKLQSQINDLEQNKANLLDMQKQQGITKYWSEHDKAYIPEETISQYVNTTYGDFKPTGDSTSKEGYGYGKSNSNNYFGAQTPEEWMNQIYNQLMPTYAEQVKNKTGPEVMKAFSESLDKPYQEGLKTIMENAASRGTSTAGLTGNQLSEALAQRNLAVQNKQENIGADLQTFLDSLAQSGYNTSVRNVSQNIMDEFKKSGQSWDDYYRTNQSAINNKINEQAAQTGIDYETLQTQNKYNDQDYLDSINAISQLWGTAGQLGGTAAYNFNNKNTGANNTTSSSSSSVPLTQAVMNNSNLYNNTNKALNTNSKTGNTYSEDLYSAGKNWLNY
jgi:hypothetical protein